MSAIPWEVHLTRGSRYFRTQDACTTSYHQPECQPGSCGVLAVHHEQNRTSREGLISSPQGVPGSDRQTSAPCRSACA